MGTANTLISIVIPVRDRLEEIQQCVSALAQVEYERKEIIIVDDASSCPLNQDDVSIPCRIIRFEQPAGPAAARNAGARAADGDLVLFLDSDCIIRPDALSVVNRLSERHPGIAAFNGFYTAPPADETIPSRFAALEMNYCFLNPPPTVFTALSAIRRDIFLKTGGFDESLKSPFADDVLLGWKLRQEGYKTMFDSSFQARHLKHYSFVSYLANSFEHHAVITRAFLEQSGRSEAGFSLPIVSTRRPINMLLVTAALLYAVFGRRGRAADSRAAGCIPWMLLAAFIANNGRLFMYLAGTIGWFHAVQALPLLAADSIATTAGFFAGLARAVSTGD